MATVIKTMWYRCLTKVSKPFNRERKVFLTNSARTEYLHKNNEPRLIPYNLHKINLKCIIGQIIKAKSFMKKKIGKYLH